VPYSHDAACHGPAVAGSRDEGEEQETEREYPGSGEDKPEVASRLVTWITDPWSTIRDAGRGIQHGGIMLTRMRRAGQPATGAQIAFARVATALAVASVGAMAVGALAIGRLVIRALRLQRGHIERLSIGELEVGRVRVREVVGLPVQPGSNNNGEPVGVPPAGTTMSGV